MKIHIQNGRVIDPANGIDRVADVFVARGRIIGIDQAPQGFETSGIVRCERLHRLSRPGRSCGAAARTGL